MTRELLRQAISLHEQGKPEDAESLIRQVLTACNTDDFEVQYMLAALRYRQGRNVEALQAVEAALMRTPGAAKALLLHGMLLLRTGKPAEALAQLDAAAARDPANPEIWYGRGLVLQRLGRLEEALTSFDRALALNPGHTHILLSRGGLLQNLGRFDEALASYDKVLAIAPNSVETWNDRGRALTNLDRFAEALASHDKALALRPGMALGWNSRGVALRGLGRNAEAMQSFNKALALAPNYIEAMRNAALLLCETNQVEQGLELYARQARIAYGGRPVAEKNDGLPHKIQHDAEQRDYLAKQNIAGDFYLDAGARMKEPAVNPLNAAPIAQQWKTNTPQIVVIDNLLTPEALAGLQRFCRNSTMWRNVYPQGYLGATPESGFACPLLAQIADELRAIFPSIFKAHALRYLWGFKYDSSLSGIEIHADFAAVNVNFWITPDEANNNPENGGLVIWDAPAPLDWALPKYNGNAKAARDFLGSMGAKSTTVPYRANRAVIFDSDLFHETDEIEFKEGYLNRRINVTMLYGLRDKDAEQEQLREPEL